MPVIKNNLLFLVKSQDAQSLWLFTPYSQSSLSGQLLLSLGSSALVQGHHELLLHPASTIPPHPSCLPCQHTPPPAKDLASDFTEKVRVTDEQTSSPSTPKPVLFLSFPPVTLEEMSSLLKMNLYMSKPFYQLSFMHLYHVEFFTEYFHQHADMLWYLST